MSTSGVYTFISPESEQIIYEAYQRIGILSPVLSPDQVKSAQRSINLILQSWPNKGNNLFTIQEGMLGLNPNQYAYNLPAALLDIKTATIRTSTRNLGGTPFSSAGGTASYAFDGNPQTACTQVSANGYISYGWGNSAQYAISMVGIQSNVTTNYTLVCEYSFDNISWTASLSIPVQSYAQSFIQWFAVPAPVPAPYFRVRETGGATLNVQELYFDTNIQDTLITRMSEYEYTGTPNKNSFTAKPSSFYVIRGVQPVVKLYPPPSSGYNNMYYTYWKAIQDVGELINNPDIPSRFLEALTADLAFKLALKNQDIASDRLQLLMALSEKAYMEAGSEDRERVPLRIYGTRTQGWAQV